MKELFDRNQERLTDAEDRRVWKALHDEVAGRRPFWKRWGIPVSAVATVTAAAVVIVMVNDTPRENVGRDLLQEPVASLEKKDSGPGADLGRADSPTETRPGRLAVPDEAAAANEGDVKDAEAGSEGAPSSERVEPLENRDAVRQRLAPTPVPVEMKETPSPIVPPVAPMEAETEEMASSADEDASRTGLFAANEAASKPGAKLRAGAVAGGIIRGKVTDAQGDPLVFANVILLGTSMGAMTDTSGVFEIDGVSPGKHTLKVTYLGYEPEETAIEVREGQMLAENFALNEAQVAVMEVVSLEAKKPEVRREASQYSRSNEEPESQPSNTFKKRAKPLSDRDGNASRDEADQGRTSVAQKNAEDAGREILGAAPAAEAPAVSGEYQGFVPANRGKPQPPRGEPIAVGGTDPVNGKVFDAMFFQHYGVNPFVDPEDDRFATFAVDVDNASFALARSYLNRGVLPPKDAIRVEEFINSFDHHYAPPENPLVAASERRRWGPSDKGTFAIHLDAAPSPFGNGLQLLRVGLKGREIHEAHRKPANLTFVVDVSGSMARENRLELVKKALFMLLDRMNTEDQVALVVYGSNARTILEPTSLHYRRQIERAINQLRPEGATNAEAGLREAYRMAERAYARNCINRVILCSDGVANVGQTGADGILNVIKQQAGEGIYLTAVGFGMGNYNDVLMEQLANKGDGNYYYVDTLDEAHKVFVENLTGTLQTIARQVKIQVEFDPEQVKRYRLLGYENRDVADRDFRNDEVDAGEVGAGHEVTALFEMKLDRRARGDVATVRIRYEDPETGKVTEEARTLRVSDIHNRLRDTDPTFRMDAAVAEFAEILRGSYWAKDGDLSRVLGMAEDAAREMGSSDETRDLVNMVAQTWNLKPSSEQTDWRVRPMWEPEEDR